MNAVISTRHGSNPDHNIWNNNGTWWCHFTAHLPGYRKQRIRVSLGTKDRDEARRQRDILMRGAAAIAVRIPCRHQAPGPRGAADILECAAAGPRKQDWRDRKQGSPRPSELPLAILPGGQ